MPTTLIDPFRIKSIEPIRMTTRAERERLLDEARLNPFRLRAEDVLIDWLTDSGTGPRQSFAGRQLGCQLVCGARNGLPTHRAPRCKRAGGFTRAGHLCG